jgi:hypothetical protein
MATYKTAPRVDYDLSFQDVAQRLFDLAKNRLVHGLPFGGDSSQPFAKPDTGFLSIPFGAPVGATSVWTFSLR